MHANGNSNRRRWTTLLFLAIGALALVAALLVGINDNPPGLILIYTAVTAFLLAWVHPWRSVKRFLILLGASLLGFPVAAVLHNLFYALAELAAEFVGLAQVLGFLDGVFFLIGVLVCPPGILVGAVGAAATAILRARRKDEPDETPS
jgi:hypothetical protein